MFDFKASLNDVAPVPPMSLSVYLMKKREWFVDGYYLCVVSFFLPCRSSFVSVVFDFNASLNDFAPVPSIQLSVGAIHHKSIKLGLLKQCIQ